MRASLHSASLPGNRAADRPTGSGCARGAALSWAPHDRHSAGAGPQPVHGPHQGLPRLCQQAVERGQVRAHGLRGSPQGRGAPAGGSRPRLSGGSGAAAHGRALGPGRSLHQASSHPLLSVCCSAHPGSPRARRATWRLLPWPLRGQPSRGGWAERLPGQSSWRLAGRCASPGCCRFDQRWGAAAHAGHTARAAAPRARRARGAALQQAPAAGRASL